jgi:hypothetical protein
MPIIHSKPLFDFHDPSIPASTQRSLSGLIADTPVYYTRVTDEVKFHRGDTPLGTRHKAQGNGLR